MCRAGARRCVCVHGAESSGLVPESEGCEDVVLTESCLTLSFTHTVQCWSLHRNGRALVWSGELNTTGNVIIHTALCFQGVCCSDAQTFLTQTYHCKNNLRESI